MSDYSVRYAEMSGDCAFWSLFLASPYHTLRKKTVLKQYPLGTTLENGTTFAKWHSFFLNNHVY